jgi:tetratricopeptide (TPR) repeat protein
VYSKKGDLDKAKDYYQRALEIKEKQVRYKPFVVCWKQGNVDHAG